MRRTLLALALTTALLAAPLAMAANENAARGQDKAATAREGRSAETAAHGGDASAADGHRPAWVTAWTLQVRSIVESWRESVTEVRETCRATELDDNASKADRLAWAHCIRDGLKAHMDEMRTLRAEARAEMKEARMAAHSS